MGSIDHGTKQQSSWQDIVARKRQSAETLIPKEWKLPASILDSLAFPLDKHSNKLIGLDIPRKSGLLTDRELDVTENYTVPELLAKLGSGEFTSLEVTTAFSKRAAIAQQLTSCLTETFFDKAIERAKYLDQCRNEGKPLGPLHGLPISIKDGFQIVGTEASIGYVSFLGKKSTTNSPLVELLLSLGAVLYVKTNIPQTLMTADSDNNIFGRTLNPHNTVLNAGGSSGGEGALVAFRGSPLGVGTDVAGSVRIPAICCGTYGFKPTASRVPYGGQQVPALAGWKPITASAGPLTNDFEALEVFVKSVIDATPALLDSTAVDVPWRALEPKVDSKLRIGVLQEDPLYPLHPPVKRILAEAAKKLEAVGHELVPLTAKEGRVSDIQEVAFELFVLHTGTSIGHIKASGEPMVPSVAKADKPANYGNYTFVPDLKDMDFVHKYASLSVLRSELSENWRKIWLEKKLDAVLAPSAQNTAVPHDNFGWPPYTAFLNLLDYPACVIPYGKASKQLDTEAVKMPAAQAQYDPDVLDGAPCSVQVFTRGFRDEECLKVARVVDECLKQS
ncbi:amidase [Exophiala viscosa]|uniref:amidase n=1 Tax=Exophiala viscosa TaxID=2486360 RepID=A0AAN6I935_9EURO|nr:amidase [Exophiala viscosa]KAI1621029.1 amidase [Exophiala viscosa]